MGEKRPMNTSFRQVYLPIYPQRVDNQVEKNRHS